MELKGMPSYRHTQNYILLHHMQSKQDTDGEFQRKLETQLEGARFDGAEMVDTFFGQQT